MDELFEKLRLEIAKLASDESFIHHKWFVKWHLEIVEKISLELCRMYKDADIDLVLGLVWIHGYAKIIDFENRQSLQTFYKAKAVLRSIGFDVDFIEKLTQYLEIFEKEMTEDLNRAPIEVKIVSSADGASHMVGPFFPVYWYENCDKDIDELLNENKKKIMRDWERRIVLPEVRISFKKRYEQLLEMAGDLPQSYL